MTRQEDHIPSLDELNELHEEYNEEVRRVDKRLKIPSREFFHTEKDAEELDQIIKLLSKNPMNF